jgi:hypothetical protein
LLEEAVIQQKKKMKDALFKVFRKIIQTGGRYGGENNLTYLNEEYNSLQKSIKIATDIEKQGHLVYSELEEQYGMLQVLLFYIENKRKCWDDV